MIENCKYGIWYVVWCPKMIIRNNNVKISIMIIVGVRQYRALSEQLMHVSRKCVELKFDMNRFLDNLSKLNCQDSSQYKSACQKNNWILYFCCNCDRHVALLFRVDGSDKKKKNQLACMFFLPMKKLANIYEIWNPRVSWFHFCYLPARSQLQCGFVFIIILSGKLALTSYTYQTRTPIPA